MRLGTVELVCEAHGLAADTPVIAAIRPENIVVHEGKDEPDNSFSVQVGWMEFLGSFFRTTLKSTTLGNAELLADFSINLVRRTGVGEGDEMTVSVARDRIRVYPEESAHG